MTSYERQIRLSAKEKGIDVRLGWFFLKIISPKKGKMRRRGKFNRGFDLRTPGNLSTKGTSWKETI